MFVTSGEHSRLSMFCIPELCSFQNYFSDDSSQNYFSSYRSHGCTESLVPSLCEISFARLKHSQIKNAIFKIQFSKIQINTDHRDVVCRDILTILIRVETLFYLIYQ